MVEAGLYPSLKSPKKAANSFRDLRVLSNMSLPMLAEGACHRHTDSRNIQTLMLKLPFVQRAVRILSRYFKGPVRKFACRRKAAVQIQRSWRWKWKSLPWAVGAIRVQRAWRLVLRRAHEADVRELISVVLDQTLAARRSALEK